MVTVGVNRLLLDVRQLAERHPAAIEHRRP
jgi:hypothetical protein